MNGPLARWMRPALLLAVFTAGCGADDAPGSMAVPETLACTSPRPAQATAASFPLNTAGGGRYFVDASGRPFLLTGDTAWSLIAQLTDDDVTAYLDDRKARGFNAVLVNLIEFRYSTRAPANAYGDAPFSVPNDFSRPNEAYFRRADRVIEKAADRGLLVLLDPAYFGYDGDGWYEQIEANGTTRIEQYGRYVGKRYGRCTNIVWVIGGDRTPANPRLGDALANGIAESAPRSLFTAHAQSEASVYDIWHDSSWLRIGSVFTYQDVWPRAVATYRRSTRPFILIESAYENDGWNAQTPTRLRAQAYHALLGGAAGQVFGNNPLWHFDGPGCCSNQHFPTTWRAALALEGSRSMSMLAAVFAGLAWERLVPDIPARFLTGGVSSGHDRAVAAVARDGSFAMAYIPSPRSIQIDLRALSGPVNLQWIDPTSGATREEPAREAGALSIATPGPNAAGAGDWLLVARSPAG